MKRRLILVASTVILLLLVGVTAAWLRSRASHHRDRQRGAAADTVLINGRILTIDPNDALVEAVAITNGRIAAVGSNATVKQMAGRDTQVIDLHGRTATAGLSDTHAHSLNMARFVHEIDLSDISVRTIDDAVDRVKQRAAMLKPGEWVRGKGWDAARLVERRSIHATDLDPVSPDNPVYLEHSSPRLAVVNSYAMKLAGISRITKDPAAGSFDRVADGRPSSSGRGSASRAGVQRGRHHRREGPADGRTRMGAAA